MKNYASIIKEISHVIGGLEQDLKNLKKLKLEKAPKRFEDLTFLKIESRFFSGTNAGGDCFDFFYSKEKSHFLFSTAPRHSLVAKILSFFSNVDDEAFLNQNFLTQCVTQIQSLLKEKEKISLFNGIFDEKNLSLKYTHFGNSLVFISNLGDSFKEVEDQGDFLLQWKTIPPLEMQLRIGTRIVFFSQGWINQLGHSKAILKLLDKTRLEALDVCLEELVFQLKVTLPENTRFFKSDCSVVLFEVLEPSLR